MTGVYCKFSRADHQDSIMFAFVLGQCHFDGYNSHYSIHVDNCGDLSVLFVMTSVVSLLSLAAVLILENRNIFWDTLYSTVVA